jgi:hypothetical protein
VNLLRTGIFDVLVCTGVELFWFIKIEIILDRRAHRNIRLFWGFCNLCSIPKRQGSLLYFAEYHTILPGNEAADAASEKATPL